MAEDIERAAGSGEDARGGLVGLALAGFVLQLATIGRYGWFRDELYYVACGRRLAWGYVDHPPMVALLSWLSRVLLGDSLPALRLLPAIAGALAVYLAGRLARELGGGRLAQLLGAAATLASPRLLGMFHVMSMNAFEVLLWTLAAYVLVRLAAGADPRFWLLFGAIAGAGLETKHSMLFLGLGVAVGLALTGTGRRALGHPWVYLGGALAALLAAPNLAWEVMHGWPTLEFLRNAQAIKNLPTTPWGFFLDQVGGMQPFALALWMGGFCWLLFASRARSWRILGWAALTVVVVLLAFHAKGYYLAPLYPTLFAAGGVAIEEALRGLRFGRVLLPAYLVLVLLGGLISAPFTVPVLPVDAFLRYQAALGMKPQSAERKAVGDLPPGYADMMGWQLLAIDVALAVHTLPPADQARACVLAGNYGEAAALEELGRPLALPPAISGHNNYYLWGPGACDGSALVVIGGSLEERRAECAELRRAGTLHLPHAMPYEDGRPLWVCRLRQPLAAAWPHFKYYE